MNPCIVLPKWRPCGRESGEGRSPHAARPHGRLRAVTQGFALRALPLRGLDTSGTQHPLPSVQRRYAIRIFPAFL